ncbi:MAG: S8 family peptidase [Flavobacteriaceae bacterium]
MKFNKIVLGLGIVALTLTSCKSTKTGQTTTTTTSSSSTMITVPEGLKAKGKDLTDAQILAWPHMDIITDGVPGISLDKAYEFVKNKKGQTVIVGIIDSGVDIEHEDLKDVVWTNSKEIPGNNKDDDGNGYVDDMHGWNFLGGEKGTAAPEQLEITRIVKSGMDKFGLKTKDQIDASDLQEFAQFTELKAKVVEKLKAAIGQKAFYSGLQNTLKTANTFLVKKIGKKDFSFAEVSPYSENAAVKPAMMYLQQILSGKENLTEVVASLDGAVSHFATQADYQYNLDFKGRVTGDDHTDWNTKSYGNNNVIGAGVDELHGTHVAGIVAASRNNGIGMNGVANNVEIMSVRAVPDGDEYDKDVALAIRYVVDNGAKVVNMSFGKAYSPQSKWVYEAMQYAAKHDVLLVKAAGNNGQDIDLPEHLHFPTDSPDTGATEITDNVLTVGAMTRHFDKKLCATFSNYGKTRVDVFAPGLEIYSTVPKDNGYKSIQGTSMASPEVAGVAALVRSYYPNLSAKQVKHIIMTSGIEYKGEVIIPGSKDKKNFSDLSVNGKILNAYNALLMADQMSK